MHPLMTELLTQAIMDDRRRQAEQYRLGHRNRPHRRDTTPTPSRRRFAGPRDTRPQGRISKKRSRARRP